ncbi:hypothetical protein [Mesorhizobium sp. RIZ17]|uniref:hypothetical protein n=1 Tax=Mesorhizobium sp. RIZ17 TaxID=3132743 RepID=UPI003DAA3CEA
MYDNSIDLLVNQAFNVSQRLRSSQSKRDREDAKRLSDAVRAVLAAKTAKTEVLAACFRSFE